MSSQENITRTTRTCFNCTHGEVCKFRKDIEKAYEGFPFAEHPGYLNADWRVNLSFSYVEPHIATMCEQFVLRNEGSIQEVAYPPVPRSPDEVSARNVVVVLRCCSCGAETSVKLSDYFGPMSICNECNEVENYMGPARVTLLDQEG